MRRREQYFEKKEVLRKVRSPTVTCIPLRPRDRTTANVFLKCPSVTRTVDIVSSEFRVQSSEFRVQSSEFRVQRKKIKKKYSGLRTHYSELVSDQSFVGEASVILPC